MAAITGTYGLVRYQSLALTCTLGSASDTISNADLLTTSLLSATANTSPLKTFLGTTFANAAAAELAFRAIGGEITMRQVSGTATTVISIAWTCTAAVPFLTLAGGADQVLELCIRTPHTIVQ